MVMKEQLKHKYDKEKENYKKQGQVTNSEEDKDMHKPVRGLIKK